MGRSLLNPPVHGDGLDRWRALTGTVRPIRFQRWVLQPISTVGVDVFECRVPDAGRPSLSLPMFRYLPASPASRLTGCLPLAAVPRNGCMRMYKYSCTVVQVWGT